MIWLGVLLVVVIFATIFAVVLLFRAIRVIKTQNAEIAEMLPLMKVVNESFLSTVTTFRYLVEMVGVGNDTAGRIEAHAELVADDLAAAHARADKVDGEHGEAADAASRSPGFSP